MSFDLEDHVRREHKRTPVSQYLREIVYGGNDGIVTTFAVVAGFAGAQKDPTSSAVPVISVLLFGLANLMADGLSMSLGSFLSIRADQDVYRNEKDREAREIVRDPDNEYIETVEILKRKNFSPQDATTIAKIYRKNHPYWTEFMMRDELQMQNTEGEKPLFVAIATLVSFVGFGFIPLLPYVARISVERVFSFSVYFTATALLLLGILRAFVSRKKPLRGILETLIVGGISASAAYFVGTFFRM